jgi:hypothetical protein
MLAQPRRMSEWEAGSAVKALWLSIGAPFFPLTPTASVVHNQLRSRSEVADILSANSTDSVEGLKAGNIDHFQFFSARIHLALPRSSLRLETHKSGAGVSRISLHARQCGG